MIICPKCGRLCYECAMFYIVIGETKRGIECDKCGFVEIETELQKT